MAAGPKRYGRRKLDGMKLPPESWLYDHSGAWRMMPEKHPKNCSWCGKALSRKAKYWRLCATCDSPEKEEKRR